MQLGDTSRSLNNSQLSCRLETEQATGCKTYFLFFAALKKDLAGSYKIVFGVASIGKGASSSSGSGAF
jgi:hypothetical protein